MTCQACGGPCRDYKGSVWGWTCAACITRSLDAAAARAADKVQRHRERLAHNTFHNDAPSLRAK
jgi:hypothetical protein